MNDIVARDDKIASKIDTEVTGNLPVSNSAGGVNFANAGQVMEFAKMLSVSNVAVPKHLRGNPGACLGIVMQAIEWRMSPFAVANKSYSVSDRLAYEAQLIHAVVLQRAQIVGRIKFEFSGDGASRTCRTWAQLKGSDEIVDYTSPRIGDIKTKNSPLWAADPDQQLGYYSVRAFCRRNFPEILMGIYSKDELEESPRIGPEAARDVTPKRSLADRLASIADNKDNRFYRQTPEAIAEEHAAEAKHDPETGEVVDKEHQEHPLEHPGVKGMTAETAEVKLAGMLAARNGQKEFTKWWRRLSPPDAERAEPYMEEFNAILAEQSGAPRG